MEGQRPLAGDRGDGDDDGVPEETRVVWSSQAFSLIEHCCGARGAGRANERELVPVPRPAIALVQFGLAELVVRRNGYEIDPGLVALVPSGSGGSVRHHGCRGRRCAISLEVGPELEAEAPLAATIRAARKITACRRDESTNLLAHELLGAYRRSDDAVVEELGVLVVEGCLRSLRTGDPTTVRQDGTERTLAVQAKEWLCQRSSQPLDLEQLASDLGYSKFHVCRTFRATVGVTLSEFLRRQRVQVALDRLAGGEDDLTALALDLGFCSHSHFSTAFRQVTGTTPTAARSRLTGRSRAPARAR